MPFLHLRYDGQSYDVSLEDLDIGDLSTDEQIKASVAQHMQVPVTKMDNYRVEKADNGDITLYPQAVFGN